MAVENEGLLSAISSAIDNGGNTPVETPADDSSTDGDDTTVAGGEDSPAADQASGAADATNDPAAGAAGKDTGEKPDPAASADAASAGKSAPAAAKDKPAADAAGKDAVKPPVDPNAKKPDPINDPIDERLKPATKERMTALVTTAKALTTERDEARGQFQEIVTAIQETGANPEQYAQALDYLRMVNSPNIADRKQCLAFMQGEIKALAISLGEPVAGVDLLSDHADLQQQVADGGISQQHAEELAASRAQRGMHQQVGARQSQQQETQAAQQRAVQAGAQQLTALEAELQAADPAGYAAKKAILVEALKPVFREINPANWASTFRAAYAKLPTPGAPAVRKTVVPAAQPLRGANPAGGAARAATSMADAINLGIEQATRR